MSIVIDIKLNTQGGRPTAIQRVTDRLKALEAQCDRVNQKLLVMNSILSSINGVASKISMPSIRAAGGGGAGGAGGGGFRAPKPPSMSQQFNDHFNAFKFFDNLSKRTNGKMGGAGRASALAAAHNSAQQLAGVGKFGALNSLLPHLVPKQKPGFMAAMKTAFMSSRFSVGGSGGTQIMPLVNKALSALSNLHPVVKGVVIALAVLTKGAMMASQAMMKFTSDRAALGGSVSQTNAAARAVNALGLGDARSVADAIRGGSSGEASAAGINTAYGAYGNNNYADVVLKALNRIAAAGSFDEARRRAEKLGIPDAAKAYYLDSRHKGELAADARRNMGMDDSQAKSSTNAFFSFNRMMDRYRLEFMKSMEWIIVGFGKFADFVNGYLDWVEQIRQKLGLSPQSDHAKAIRENTRATNELNRTMRDSTEYYGGGARARGSMPERLNSINKSDAATRAALGNGVPIG